MALAGIGSAIGGLIGSYTSGKGGEGKLKEITRLWKELNTPHFDARSLSPAELQLVAEAFPETYEAIIQGQPELATEGPEGREAQLSSLGYLDTAAREGLGVAERLAAQEAGLRISDYNRRAQGALRGELAQRGRLGGGTEAVLRMGAGQQGANLAAQEGRDLMQAAIENRYRANLARGQMGGQLRQSDLAKSATNAAAVNRFNEIASQLRTRAQQDAAAARERAQGYNIGTRQRIADENERARYQALLGDINRQNLLKQQGFQNEVTRLGGVTNALGQQAAYKEAKRAERIQNASNIGGAIGSIGDTALSAFGGVGGLLGGGGGAAAAPSSANLVSQLYGPSGFGGIPQQGWGYHPDPYA